MSPSKTMIPAIDSQGDSAQISLKRAREYEHRGRGHFEGGEARFVFSRDGSDHRHVSVVASQAKRYSARHDDGLATLEQVEGLPVTGQAIRLFTGKRRSPQSYMEDRVVLLSVCQQPRESIGSIVPTWKGRPLAARGAAAVRGASA